MTITYALIQMLEKVAENSDRAKIICKAKATKSALDRRQAHARTSTIVL